MQLETENSNPYTTLEFTKKVSETISTYIDREVHLDPPLQSVDDFRMNLIHTNERNYARYLITQGILVFNEPEIPGIIQVPDFFVWKLGTSFRETPYSGTFIELTLCTRKGIFDDSKYCRNKYARKRRQKEVFEKLGLPIIYVCKEDQKKIQNVSDFRLN
jgi:hypothetical protein